MPPVKTEGIENYNKRAQVPYPASRAEGMEVKDIYRGGDRLEISTVILIICMIVVVCMAFKGGPDSVAGFFLYLLCAAVVVLYAISGTIEAIILEVIRVHTSLLVPR